MNILAVLIGGYALGVAIFVRLTNRVEGREHDIMRNADNQYRLDLARSVGYGFYSYEDSNGSLSWRRVPSN